MPNFLVRVQLDGVGQTTKTYEALHALMFRMGLKLNIELTTDSGDEVYFATPHATYYGMNMLGTVVSLRDAVASAIEREIWLNVEVMVVQTAGIAVQGHFTKL